MRRHVQQIFVRCAQATSASETHAQDPPIPNPKLGLLLALIFRALALALIFRALALALSSGLLLIVLGL
jgi:hypothetical protein